MFSFDYDEADDEFLYHIHLASNVSYLQITLLINKDPLVYV